MFSLAPEYHRWVLSMLAGRQSSASPAGNRSALTLFASKQKQDFVMANRRRATSRGPTRRKSAKNKATRRKPRTKASNRWSQRVSRESDALDLQRGVFTLGDPKRIATSLKRSAERSTRRKAGAYRSAVSMLTFYINRAGRTLPKAQRARLERAKLELKRQFGRD